MPADLLTLSELLDRLDERDERVSVERRSQTLAFSEALDRQGGRFEESLEKIRLSNADGFRSLTRIGGSILILLILSVLALAGVGVRYGQLSLQPVASAAANPGLP